MNTVLLECIKLKFTAELQVNMCCLSGMKRKPALHHISLIYCVNKNLNSLVFVCLKTF